MAEYVKLIRAREWWEQVRSRKRIWPKEMRVFVDLSPQKPNQIGPGSGEAHLTEITLMQETGTTSFQEQTMAHLQVHTRTGGYRGEGDWVNISDNAMLYTLKEQPPHQVSHGDDGFWWKDL